MSILKRNCWIIKDLCLLFLCPFFFLTLSENFDQFFPLDYSALWKSGHMKKVNITYCTTHTYMLIFNSKHYFKWNVLKQNLHKFLSSSRHLKRGKNTQKIIPSDNDIAQHIWNLLTIWRNYCLLIFTTRLALKHLYVLRVHPYKDTLQAKQQSPLSVPFSWKLWKYWYPCLHFVPDQNLAS